MPDADFADDLALIEHWARECGPVAMRYFGTDAETDPEVWLKGGTSPVSEADYAVDTLLKRELRAARPDYGWLSEETEDNPAPRLAARRTFVVDPIDGTRGFLKGDRRWCIAVAIVEEGRPIAGVLHCPALERTFCASRGGGAFLDKNRLRCAAPVGSLKVTAPTAVQTAALAELDRTVERAPFVPSLAYRVALVATGETDVTLVRGQARDWDLAAADLVLCEAGGRLTTLAGEPLLYNRADTTHGVLVATSGDVASGLHGEMLEFATLQADKARG